jgi:hypothetical protein
MTLIDIATEFEQAEARLRAAVRDPERQQEEKLREILTTNRDTEYGRRFDFASITDLRTYRARMPLVSYTDVLSYIDRIVDGEPDVLFAGRATFIGRTTGTTAAPKRVGFNPPVRGEYLHLLGPIIHMLERDHPGASRMVVLLTAQFEEDFSRAGIPIGNGSGFARRSMEEHPYFRFAPEPVYECRDADARSYMLLRLAVQRPIRCFASLFPTLLSNFFRRADELSDALADDLERGTMEAGPPGIRQLAPACAVRLRALPELARRMRDIKRAHGRFVPSEYWTDVSALQVWKAGTAKHGLAELQAVFPQAEIRPMISGSTEAALMVPLESTSCGGVPALCSTVMEFLPADADPHPDAVVTLRDLEEGRGYRCVVTNHRGFYRYVMEDVFVIEGYVDGVPSLKLDHRIGVVSSLAGEKMKEEHVTHAIDVAIAASGVQLKLFQVSPEKLTGTTTSYRYAVQVELEGDLSDEALRRFASALEADLRQHNSQYALNRNLGALGAPVVYCMKPGYFDAVLRARAAARGRTDAQLKPIAFSGDLLVLDPAWLVAAIEA